MEGTLLNQGMTLFVLYISNRYVNRSRGLRLDPSLSIFRNTVNLLSLSYFNHFNIIIIVIIRVGCGELARLSYCLWQSSWASTRASIAEQSKQSSDGFSSLPAGYLSRNIHRNYR